ncbi:hypothetical protein EYZ11_013085 [Aspergillus tanneri]|uniref:RNase H type-1 domain-containing protein n=1 Tax=Aspergillus tanneri TaxID=1220188 RepID=A0A4S3J3Z9_9EURO|nr:hypothetical protein EYZ11_013085 [Aspergillus tanneri]
MDRITTWRHRKRIQTRAAILISGAFRNTAAAALGVELYLPPMRIQMQQIIQETAIRIQTGPSHTCPRGLRLQRGREETWESRVPYVIAPWELPLRCIISNAEQAVQDHDRICHTDRQVWYSDGSGYCGSVGAAAVSIRAGKVLKKHLGTESQSTVYVGELEGARMALEQSSAGVTPITVFADSQAAILAMGNPKRPSGQYALREIYARVRELRQQGPAGEDVEIRWIPAHIGVEGNEQADMAAKDAATGGAAVEISSVGASQGRPIIRLAVAAKRDVRQSLREQWERQRVGKPTRRLLPTPDKRNIRLYEHLSKPHTSIIMQMRTMRIGLRHFLFKIKQVDSDRCECDLGSQTPRHVLLECPLHTTCRGELMRHLDVIEGLRGRVQDYDAVISNPQAIRYVAEFMHQTGLLQQFRFAKLSEEDEEAPIQTPFWKDSNWTRKTMVRRKQGGRSQGQATASDARKAFLSRKARNQDRTKWEECSVNSMAR